MEWNGRCIAVAKALDGPDAAVRFSTCVLERETDGDGTTHSGRLFGRLFRQEKCLLAGFLV